MNEVRTVAPAKVNLDLFVLGKRGDGFHELSTTMMLVGLQDELVLRVAGDAGVRLELDGPALGGDMPGGSSNLAVAALEQGLAALEQTGVSVPGVELKLTKRIPSGAGLGGGSSDAAAALIGLQELLGAQLDPQLVAGILAELGSDCVFFQAARSTGLARCTGRGEQVEVLPAPAAWWIVLLTPDVFASTKMVFGALDVPATGEKREARGAPYWSRLTAHEARAMQHNDLQAPALLAIPELQVWRDLLPETFLLSGSGSSFYALCADQDEAQALLQTVQTACAVAGMEPRILKALPLS
jgi:4-diphosphocytidyl-2-C-methyl-D-erythritol kinase